MSNSFDSIFDAVVDGDQKTVGFLVDRALIAETSPQDILNEALIPAMAEVGDMFESGEYFVPDMLLSARAMKSGMDKLKPHMMDGSLQSQGLIALGAVKGDLHDIGKNLVSIMLESAGFKVIDLGVDVPPERFVEVVRDEGVRIIGMSCLLTTTVPAMKKVIAHLTEAGLRDDVTVLVGGAPVTENIAKQIGADYFAPEANQAVKLVKSLH